MNRSWVRQVSLVTALLAASFAYAPPAQAYTISGYAGGDGRLEVMPLGDSLTRGQGDPMWAGYRMDLRARLASVGQNPNFVGPWIDGNGDHEHAGTGGARIDQVNVQVPQLMGSYRPDVVIVMLGTNDVGQRYQLDGVQERMISLLRRIRQFRPAARVFVATIPKWANADQNVYVDQVNGGIAAAVVQFNDAKTTLIPVGSLAGADPAKELGPDGVHLTPCGYARVAFILWTHMALSDLRPPSDAWLGGWWPWDNTGVCA